MRFLSIYFCLLFALWNFGAEQSLTLYPGWNTVAVEVAPAEGEVRQLIESKAGRSLTVWAWREQSYQAAPFMVPGEAYWLFFDGAKPLTVRWEGEPLPTRLVERASGWHLSGFDEPMTGPLLDLTGQSVSDFWLYDAAGFYQSTPAYTSGEAVWLYLANPAVSLSGPHPILHPPYLVEQLTAEVWQFSWFPVVLPDFDQKVQYGLFSSSTAETLFDLNQLRALGPETTLTLAFSEVDQFYGLQARDASGTVLAQTAPILFEAKPSISMLRAEESIKNFPKKDVISGDFDQFSSATADWQALDQSDAEQSVLANDLRSNPTALGTFAIQGYLPDVLSFKSLQDEGQGLSFTAPLLAENVELTKDGRWRCLLADNGNYTLGLELGTDGAASFSLKWPENDQFKAKWTKTNQLEGRIHFSAYSAVNGPISGSQRLFITPRKMTQTVTIDGEPVKLRFEEDWVISWSISGLAGQNRQTWWFDGRVISGFDLLGMAQPTVQHVADSFILRPEKIGLGGGQLALTLTPIYRAFLEDQLLFDWQPQMTLNFEHSDVSPEQPQVTANHFLTWQLTMGPLGENQQHAASTANTQTLFSTLRLQPLETDRLYQGLTMAFSWPLLPGIDQPVDLSSLQVLIEQGELRHLSEATFEDDLMTANWASLGLEPVTVTSRAGALGETVGDLAQTQQARLQVVALAGLELTASAEEIPVNGSVNLNLVGVYADGSRQQFTDWSGVEVISGNAVLQGPALTATGLGYEVVVIKATVLGQVAFLQLPVIVPNSETFAQLTVREPQLALYPESSGWPTFELIDRLGERQLVYPELRQLPAGVIYDGRSLAVSSATALGTYPILAVYDGLEVSFELTVYAPQWRVILQDQFYKPGEMIDFSVEATFIDGVTADVTDLVKIEAVDEAQVEGPLWQVFANAKPGWTALVFHFAGEEQRVELAVSDQWFEDPTLGELVAANSGVSELTEAVVLGTTFLVVDGTHEVYAVRSLQGLEALVNLQFLSVTDLTGLDLTPIFDLPKVETLSIVRSGLDTQLATGVNWGRSFPNLKQLNISGNPLDSLSPLGTLTRLEDLVAEFMTIDPETLSGLDRLRGLEQLRLISLNGNLLSSLQPLSALDQVQRLSLKFCIADTTQGINALTGLADLQVIYLEQGRLTGEVRETLDETILRLKEKGIQVIE